MSEAGGVRGRLHMVNRILSTINILAMGGGLAWTLYIVLPMQALHEKAGGELTYFGRVAYASPWLFWVIMAALTMFLIVAKDRRCSARVALVLNLVALPGIALGILLLTIVLFTESFYIGAGTWDDDPRNWYRAFQEEQPPEITVCHSRYWGSAHWTEEHIYHFEIQAPPEWTAQFLSDNRAETTTSNWRFENNTSLPWFLPGPAEDYNVWCCTVRESRGVRVYVNKRTGRIYLYHYIV